MFEENPEILVGFTRDFQKSLKHYHFLTLRKENDIAQCFWSFSRFSPK
jgi:hypothetical protein